MESKFDKATAIAELMTQHAKATILNVSALANASRKKPRIISNNKDFRSRLLRRRRIGLLTANLSISQMMAYTQLNIILVTPIPKFPIGGESSVVGEPEEIIITPSGEIFRPPIDLIKIYG